MNYPQFQVNGFPHTHTHACKLKHTYIHTVAPMSAHVLTYLYEQRHTHKDTHTHTEAVLPERGQTIDKQRTESSFKLSAVYKHHCGHGSGVCQ